MAGIKIINIFWALVGGIIPTFLWLWFWFHQYDEKPNTPTFLSFLYILGMVCIILILPFKNVIQSSDLDPKEYILAFAAIEEIIKTIMTGLIAFRHSIIKRPTDYTLYLVTTALGFSALENTLYLIQPITQNNISFVLFTGNLRFIGATLLHTVCVAIVGIMIGIAHYDNAIMKWVHGIFGLGLAICLHAIFNYFILLNTTRSIMIGLGIIVIVIFGRLQKLHLYNKPMVEVPQL